MFGVLVAVAVVVVVVACASYSKYQQKKGGGSPDGTEALNTLANGTQGFHFGRHYAGSVELFHHIHGS